MANHIITRGNSRNLDFVVKQDGVKLTQAQLDVAPEINFQAKVNQQDADIDAVINKNLADGVSTLPDGAETDANVRVALTRTDTLVDPGLYFFGLEVVFSATVGGEVEVIDKKTGDRITKLEITQDTLRSS
jgi:hypothetical protein